MMAHALSRGVEHGLSTAGASKCVRHANARVRLPATDGLPYMSPGRTLRTCKTRESNIFKIHGVKKGSTRLAKPHNASASAAARSVSRRAPTAASRVRRRPSEPLRLVVAWCALARYSEARIRWLRASMNPIEALLYTLYSSAVVGIGDPLKLSNGTGIFTAEKSVDTRS